MRLQRIQERIAELFGRFVTEVQGNGGLGNTDINRFAQDVCCDLFKVIRSHPNLRNLDVFEKQNHPAIDLADNGARVAFQITSDTGSAKIHETLKTFTARKLYNQYDRLTFYYLVQKQGSYSADFTKDHPVSFDFDPARDLIDHKDLQVEIRRLPIEVQQRVLDILETHLGDEAQAESVAVRNRFASHEDTFVPPAEFDQAVSVLRQHGIVILVGPPHIGKTDTGYALVLRAAREAGYGRVHHVTRIDNWTTLNSLEHRAILLDDLFGASIFDNHTAADRFDDIIRLAQRNLIVITTRSEVLTEARSTRRLGESGRLDSLIVEMRQEGSYNNAALYNILEKHIQYALTSPPEHGPALLPAQGELLLKASAFILNELRFPHNIAFLVHHHAATSLPSGNFRAMIEAAKDIKRATALWYRHQDRTVQVVAAALSLFPNNPTVEMQELVTTACSQFQIPGGLLNRIAKSSAEFINVDANAAMWHPSYAEGVIAALIEDDIDFAWDLIRIRAKQTHSSDIIGLIQCRRTARQLAADDCSPLSNLTPILTTLEHYFTEYVTTYDTVIDRNFPAMRVSFEPHSLGPSSIHVDTNEDGTLNCWAHWHWHTGRSHVSFSVNESQSEPGKLSKLDVEARNQFLNPTWHYYPDIAHAIPQIEALDSVIEPLKRLLKEQKRSTTRLLSESWQLRMARLLISLDQCGYPMSSISPATPLNAHVLETWSNAFFEYAEGQHGLVTFPTTPIAISPHWRTLNKVDIPTLIDDVIVLAERGHPVTGQLLIPRDLASDTVHWRPPAVFDSDYYSDAQLQKAVQYGLEATFEAFKETVKYSFPTLRDHMWRYNNLPVQVLCVLDRTESDLTIFDRPNIAIRVSRLRDASPGEVCRSRVLVLSDSSTQDDQDEAIRARNSIWHDEDEDELFGGGFDQSCFLRLSGWRGRVIDLIYEDLHWLTDGQ